MVIGIVIFQECVQNNRAWKEITKKINMSNCFSVLKIEPDFSKYDHYVNIFHFPWPGFLLRETLKEWGGGERNMVQKSIVFRGKKKPKTLRKNCSLEMSAKSKAVDFSHLYGCSKSSF